MSSLENSSQNTQNKNLISIDPSFDNSKQVGENKKQSQKEICELLIRGIILDLTRPKDLFKKEDVYEKIKDYINEHERFLYSSISNAIFAYFEENKGKEGNLSLMSNLEELFLYSEKLGEKEIHPSIIKLWDHVNLANRQYTMLKLSDDEYKKKFEENKEAFKIEFKSELSKEINAQMLIMVSIFTALAFLIFGSMSSLDGIFEKTDLPLFKTLSIACVWGLCVSNMIFLFLSCVGKMTNLPISKEDKTSCCFFKRYNLFCWNNIILMGLLSISFLLYGMQCYMSSNKEEHIDVSLSSQNILENANPDSDNSSSPSAETEQTAEEHNKPQIDQPNK
ncbi:hypothetical protein J6U76_04425 [bacterium]|nr:hypothetical protein [bacterium]